MSNPLLNENRLQKAAEADSGWAAPAPESRRPIDDGPVSPWNPTTTAMTLGGTVSATAVLFVLLLAGAGFGWAAVEAPRGEVTEFPALAIGGVLVGLVCAIVLAFKPNWARVLGPVYAVAQGFFVGAISRAYETYYDGIVVQAAGATVAVFAVMLALYGLRIIKVTDRFRRIVIGATLGLMVFYGVSLLLSLFGAQPSFISSASAFGIGFSVVVAVLAAMNLALDFDFIERGVAEKYPRSVEWFAAFGLLVTVVWLYLEILRLLAKLRDR
ncbi:MAG: Bax inhibitor-1/YccA family protein [Actinomycetota bacterium]|nr:Bax inhibitor-1/YccA family protein [Actinomycetota bacterium]